MELEFHFRREGGALTGSALLPEGASPMSAIKFENLGLSAEFNASGRDIALKATLIGGALSGTWEEIGGGMQGTWSATRNAGTASACAAGSWSATAATPKGDMEFKLEFKQSGEGLTGGFVTPTGSIPFRSVQFAKGTLSFEVTFMGGTYRVEGTVAADEYSGRWADVAGPDNGKFTAKRIKS